MYIAIERVTNKRYEAAPEIKDLVLECPMCRRSVIAKTGEIKAHHFAHRHKNCGYYDYKGMSKWHIEWQKLFKTEQREVRIKRDGKTHIADAKNSNGVVIEFQHSSISKAQKEERDIFYDKLIWVVDASSISANIHLGKKLIPTDEYIEYREAKNTFNYEVSRFGSEFNDLNKEYFRSEFVNIWFNERELKKFDNIIEDVKLRVSKSIFPKFEGQKFLKNTYYFKWKWQRYVWINGDGGGLLVVPVFLDMGNGDMIRVLGNNKGKLHTKKDFIARYCV